MAITFSATAPHAAPANAHAPHLASAPHCPAFRRLVGRSPALTRALDRLARVAPTPLPVLVHGESGTGKEMAARALHELGRRAAGPYVVVNCGALPQELAESELFGHERGAFTGAQLARGGWFEEASGGTLVLDEIGELPLSLQPKLLRVLETGRLRRLGGRGEVTVDVRIVGLTNRDLRREATAGRFRLDLYHRIAGVEVTLPPLRARKEDLPLLAEHFLDELAPELGPLTLSDAALECLREHDWPGNVRELRNLVRRAAVIAGPEIDAAAVIDELGLVPGPRALRACDAAADAAAFPAGPAARPRTSADLIHLPGRTWADIERHVFKWALRRNGGSRRRAAAALGISRSTFCDRVRRMDLSDSISLPAGADGWGAPVHPVHQSLAPTTSERTSTTPEAATATAAP